MDKSKNTEKYHKIVNSLYDDGKLDENDIESLDTLKRDITDAYAKGKISEPRHRKVVIIISFLLLLYAYPTVPAIPASCRH